MILKTHIALHNFLMKCGARENVALAQYSTVKVGGPARYFLVPHTMTEIKNIQNACLEYGTHLHILSGGSNTLFSDDGFDGVVVKLGSVFDFIEVSNHGLHLNIGAATSFAKVAKLAQSFGWAAAVGWYGIPGLIGGAIRMNAGTQMGEIKDAIAFIHGIMNGQEIIFEKKDIEFGYRHTNLPDDLLICKAQFSYDRCLLEPTANLIAKTQEYRLKRRLTQPTNNSLGSFFKNPYPSFAAQLIEKCNLKGLRYKGAQISPLHANFIVNNGGAFASDILHVASIAQKTVFDRFGITLQPEVRMVGTFVPKNSLYENICAPIPHANLE
jgi:UDP-N-acetylmuramate dehydrogenase